MRPPRSSHIFFFNDTATTEIYTLSLHDALPIFYKTPDGGLIGQGLSATIDMKTVRPLEFGKDRKSTRLNSSHLGISYAVFCLKKKKSNRRAGVLQQRDADSDQSRYDGGVPEQRS